MLRYQTIGIEDPPSINVNKPFPNINPNLTWIETHVTTKFSRFLVACGISNLKHQKRTKQNTWLANLWNVVLQEQFPITSKFCEKKTLYFKLPWVDTTVHQKDPSNKLDWPMISKRGTVSRNTCYLISWSAHNSELNSCSWRLYLAEVSQQKDMENES